MKRTPSLFKILVGIVALIAACTNPSRTQLYLSVEELKEAGYYAYVLPEEIEADLGLEREIYIYSLDSHCGHGASAYLNPVQVRYTDSEGIRQLNIMIYHGHPIFDLRRETVSLDLDSRWIPDGTGRYYQGELSSTALLFKDKFGMDVVVDAFMNPEQLAQLISELEYIGPNPDSVSDPWLEACA